MKKGSDEGRERYGGFHNAMAPDRVKSHRLFRQDDYDYLKNKGYSDAEIVKLWDEDLARGATEGTGHGNKPWKR